MDKAPIVQVWGFFLVIFFLLEVDCWLILLSSLKVHMVHVCVTEKVKYNIMYDVLLSLVFEWSNPTIIPNLSYMFDISL